ncbi:hypothetical protein Pmani_001963 [Petrolisthes manimaculis]|uniref:SWIM-type domain-containing protein n=2 Tax=Petrolisthes manimaculis TaxID=1843537 RepID=A0AAE1QIV4_9EUCA|nr:hypothetical protein Pmani_001963 [Petrolisthes manimaculis]
MFEAIQKYAQANPEVVINYQHYQNSFCVVLITPFMFRAHKALKEAGEVVFVDATSCVDQLNTAITPFMCAGPGGAVPLAILLTSSQDEATLTKGFAMVKEALGESGFYGRGEPQCFITDNCEPERKALASTWPTSKQFLCIFHVLQQVWRWLLDCKHGIPKENRQDLMKMTKSLVYASSKEEFIELWKKVEAHALLEKYSNFKSYMTTLVQRKEECKAYNTVQLLIFMVEIFDAYMRQRLVDVALRRRRLKSITVEKYPTDAVKSIGESLYSVQSQSDPTQVYEVDLAIGMCTCVKGQTGAICKHQVACAEYSMTAVPQILVLDCSSRQWLAALAVGTENAPKEDFFKGLTEIEDEEISEDKGLEQNMIVESDPVLENNEEDFERCDTEYVAEDISDVTADSEVAAEALMTAVKQCANGETQVALKKFIKQISSVKTPNQLNSLLNCAGSSIKYSAVGRVDIEQEAS